MPAWDDHDTLTEDPQREISLIYYPNRDGLEDRVFRIKTERSSASMPEPRTVAHPGATSKCWPTTACRWTCASTGTPSATATKPPTVTSVPRFYRLDIRAEQPLITRKKVVLKNDYIHQVIDIYHI